MTVTTEELTAAQAAAADDDALEMGRIAGKYLTFYLAGEEYGIEILKVQEIIGMMPITPVPRMPSYMRGVINLRGKIIPVIELRTKFDMDQTEQTVETCMIVVSGRDGEVGVVVDKVSEVLDVAAADIEQAPDLGGQVQSDFILGIGKCEGNVKFLLDIETVIGNAGAVDEVD